MTFLNKLRFPYRDDTAFGLLALCVFFVPLVFSQFSNENFESVKFAFFLILTAAAGLTFFLGKQRRVLIVHKYFFIALSGFLSWAVVTAIFAQDKIYSFFGYYYRYTSGVIFYLTFSLFIFLLFQLLNKERLLFLLKILVFDALLVAISSFLEAFGWLVYLGPQEGLSRGPSFLGNPDYSAMFLAAALPLTLFFLYQAKTFRSKIYYWVVTFFLILSNAVLASRSALLAVVIATASAVCILLFCSFDKKIVVKFLAIFFASCLLTALWLNISRPQAVSSIITNADVNTSSRLYAWNVSFIGIKDSPLLGFGPGNYALFFEKFRTPDLADQIGIFDDAHNLFLQLAVTGGLPLLICFLVIIGIPVFNSLKGLKREQDLLSVALITSLIAWLVAACFNPVAITLYIFLGVLLYGLMLSHSNIKFISFTPPRYIKVIFGTFFFLLLGWGAINLVSEHLLGFSLRSYAAENYSQSYKLSGLAYRLNPTNGLYLIYNTAAAINLGQSENGVYGKIKLLEQLHPTQASSFVTASNLAGLMYYDRRHSSDLQVAIVSMQQALVIDPLFSGRWGQLAIDYYQLGDLTDAKIACLRDLSLNPHDFFAYVLLSKIYQINGNKTATIASLSAALNLNPNLPQLLYIIKLAKTLPDIKKVPIQIAVPPPSF